MIVVYTTIFGRSDSLKQAPSGASRSVCFVDDPDVYMGEWRGWELIKHPAPNPRREAWHLRCMPHVLFPTAQKTVWIDASFTLTNLEALLLDATGHELCGLPHQARTTCYDEGREIIKVGQANAALVNRQLNGYHDQGFRPTALTISCILVRLNSQRVQAFNERWDDEIALNPGDNTQLSLDYAAWATGVKVHHLHGVRKDNPYAIHDHGDHKRRRTAYDTDTTVRRG